MRIIACLSSAWVVRNWSSIKVFKSWKSQFTKYIQIFKKNIWFRKIQTSRKRWIFDRADWSFLQTIFLLINHEIWIFLLSSEWEKIISWSTIRFIIFKKAWSSNYLIAQKNRFYIIINKIRILLILCLFSIFLRISFFNFFCYVSAFL